MSVTKFGLAVNRRRKQDGQPDVDFFNITAFGKLGENAAQYLRKGRKACVVGPCQGESFMGKDGTPKFSMNVVAEDIEFLPSAPRDGEGGAQGGGGYYGAQAQQSAPQGKTYQGGGDGKFSAFDESDEDELPF
jgi:single-strand DNA-binding protein